MNGGAQTFRQPGEIDRQLVQFPVMDTFDVQENATIERGDRHQFAIADRGACTGVTAKWLHTRDPKPQKQKVKLKGKPKEKHLRALQHPEAVKAPAKSQAKKEQ